MLGADFWKLLAGLGFFLYGMFHIEATMKQIEGRSFKLFLQKNTQQKLLAIISGLAVTAVLQSSSIVNLLVLSFVGAGILSMRNALAVVLGANIGGTFNSWLVAFLGFKIELNLITLPLIGLSGIALIALDNKNKPYKIARFCMGAGMLLLGLQFMKESMDAMIQHFDFTPYLQYNLIVFVLIGFIITSIIQTSSATVVLTLSALHAKIIPIETGIAVILGAELGTTIKLGLGAIGGIAAKKRVALGNFIFNISTSLFGFIFLAPLVQLLNQLFGLQDPIIVLVSFQTLINIIGVIAFYFFLNKYSRFLENRFKDTRQPVTEFLPLASPELTESAIEMLEKEIGLFISRTIKLNLQAFQIDLKYIPTIVDHAHPHKNGKPGALSHHEQYNRMKEAEGEIVAFYAKLLEHNLNKQQLSRVNKLIEAAKNAMYAAKGMKDIYANRLEFSSSVNDLKFGVYQEICDELITFYTELVLAFNMADTSSCIKQLSTLQEKNKTVFEQRSRHYYSHAGKDHLNEKDISTLFNVNRELYSSGKAIILSVKDFKGNNESELSSLNSTSI